MKNRITIAIVMLVLVNTSVYAINSKLKAATRSFLLNYRALC
jgi:hypothetical protein